MTQNRDKRKHIRTKGIHTLHVLNNTDLVVIQVFGHEDDVVKEMYEKIAEVIIQSLQEISMLW